MSQSVSETLKDSSEQLLFLMSSSLLAAELWNFLKASCVSLVGWISLKNCRFWCISLISVSQSNGYHWCKKKCWHLTCLKAIYPHPGLNLSFGMITNHNISSQRHLPLVWPAPLVHKCQHSTGSKSRWTWKKSKIKLCGVLDKNLPKTSCQTNSQGFFIEKKGIQKDLFCIPL